VVTHQLQVEHWTAKARRPKTDVLLLDHANNLVETFTCAEFCDFGRNIIF